VRLCGRDRYRALAIYAATGCHCDEDAGRPYCWPSIWRLARLCGIRDVRTAKRIVAKLTRIGVIELHEHDGKPGYRLVPCDGPPDYVPVTIPWLERWAALSDMQATLEEPIVGATGAALFWLIRGACGRTGVFEGSVNQLATLCGASRATLNRWMPLLREHGLLSNLRFSHPKGGSNLRFSHPKGGSNLRHEEKHKCLEEKHKSFPEEKHETSEEKQNTSARKNRERPVSHSSTEKAESKPITTNTITGAQLAEVYRQCYTRQHGVPCPWDEGDTVATERTVQRLTAWGPDVIARCLRNLFESQDGVCTKKPSRVLRLITEYVASPLNAYGRPLQQRDLTPYEQAQQRIHHLRAEIECDSAEVGDGVGSLEEAMARMSRLAPKIGGGGNGKPTVYDSAKAASAAIHERRRQRREL